MKLFVSDSFADLYKQIRNTLYDEGIECNPRGMRTLEIPGVCIRLRDPKNRLGYHSERKFNLMFAIAESIMMFSGTSDVKFLSQFNKIIEEFSDNGITLYGSYAPRVAISLHSVVDKLRNDPDTRQAVIPILRGEDLNVNTKDLPCTIALQLRARGSHLDMFVYMRSNDLFWGLPYDLFNFTVFQEVIANELGLNVGEYTHIASSLHVYEHHYEMLEKVDSLVSVRCSVPYKIDDMVRLASIVNYMSRSGEISVYDAIELKPFGSLLWGWYVVNVMNANVNNVYEKTVYDGVEWAKMFTKSWMVKTASNS